MTEQHPDLSGRRVNGAAGDVGGDAPTRRGMHGRLAAMAELPPAGARSSAPFRPNRTLRLRVEFLRQLKRRRTQWTAVFLLVLPIIMALAFELGGSSGTGGSNGAPALVDLATAGAGNFALFTEFAAVGFLLVVIVAMF